MELAGLMAQTRGGEGGRWHRHEASGEVRTRARGARYLGGALFVSAFVSNRVHLNYRRNLTRGDGFSWCELRGA